MQCPVVLQKEQRRVFLTYICCRKSRQSCVWEAHQVHDVIVGPARVNGLGVVLPFRVEKADDGAVRVRYATVGLRAVHPDPVDAGSSFMDIDVSLGMCAVLGRLSVERAVALVTPDLQVPFGGFVNENVDNASSVAVALFRAFVGLISGVKVGQRAGSS